jgi:hypothetical protein
MRVSSSSNVQPFQRCDSFRYLHAWARRAAEVRQEAHTKKRTAVVFPAVWSALDFCTERWVV